MLRGLAWDQIPFAVEMTTLGRRGGLTNIECHQIGTVVIMLNHAFEPRPCQRITLFSEISF